MKNEPMPVNHGMPEINRLAWQNQFISVEVTRDNPLRDFNRKRPRLKETQWIKIKSDQKES
jgi:hypothetical protein